MKSTKRKRWTVAAIVLFGSASFSVICFASWKQHVHRKVESRIDELELCLAGMQAAINNFYAVNAAGERRPPVGCCPTLIQLITPGVALIGNVPDNPFDFDDEPNNVVDATGYARGTIINTDGGWCYNPEYGEVWANTCSPGVDENRL